MRHEPVTDRLNICRGQPTTVTTTVSFGVSSVKRGVTDRKVGGPVVGWNVVEMPNQLALWDRAVPGEIDELMDSPQPTVNAALQMTVPIGR